MARYLSSHTGAQIDDAVAKITNLIQDLSNRSSVVTLNSTVWNDLKSNQYTVVSGSISGLSASSTFIRVKITINLQNYVVLLIKNGDNNYVGTFFVAEDENLYELTVYFKGAQFIFKCALVYGESSEYDYAQNNSVVTLYRAPYSQTGSEVTIL